MILSDIRNLISEDLLAVNHLIIERLSSDVVLINKISHHIINSGGKRLRPLLVLLCARACGYKGNEHRLMAAVIEFIHTSTLLHDDVVDESSARRGNKTANEIWGNAASVLVGDFLYSRSFEMMVELGQIRIMQVMSKATNIIAEGEVLQLLNCHDVDTTQARYMEVIYRKTAKLFEAATQMGPILANKPELEEAFIAYGRHLGAAFQLIDDALDYTGNAETLGKNIGDDLAEGKPTLPLIYSLQNGTKDEKLIIHSAIKKEGIILLDEVIKIVKKSGAIDYTINIAKSEAELAKTALSLLTDSGLKTALCALADLAVNRSH